jgi:Protein of unknown function (DUF998)
MNRHRLVLSGVAAAIVYTGTVIAGAAISPGYSHLRDHISTLTQAGAVNRPLLVPPFLIYNLLALASGLALIEIAGHSTFARSILGRLGGWAIVVVGVTGALILAFPQDPVGSPVTAGGTFHIALAAAASLLTMVAVGLIGAWLLGAGSLRPVAWYSFATLGIVFSFGLVTAIATANLDPFMGLYQRVTIFGFIQWLLVIGVVFAGRDVPVDSPQPRYA